MKRGDLKKKMAEVIHSGWRGFVSFIMLNGENKPDGSIVISKNVVDRWKRMAKSTHYKLNPNEKKWAFEIINGLFHVTDLARRNAEKKKTPPDPRVNEVKKLFLEYTKNIKGFTPKINHPVDGKKIKEALKDYSVEEITDLFDWFMNSDSYEDFSCSIKTILSTGVINSWLKDRG